MKKLTKIHRDLKDNIYSILAVSQLKKYDIDYTNVKSGWKKKIEKIVKTGTTSPKFIIYRQLIVVSVSVFEEFNKNCFAYCLDNVKPIKENFLDKRKKIQLRSKIIEEGIKNNFTFGKFCTEYKNINLNSLRSSGDTYCSIKNKTNIIRKILKESFYYMKKEYKIENVLKNYIEKRHKIIHHNARIKLEPRDIKLFSYTLLKYSKLLKDGIEKLEQEITSNLTVGPSDVTKSKIDKKE